MRDDEDAMCEDCDIYGIYGITSHFKTFATQRSLLWVHVALIGCASPAVVPIIAQRYSITAA